MLDARLGGTIPLDVILSAPEVSTAIEVEQPPNAEEEDWDEEGGFFDGAFDIDFSFGASSDAETTTVEIYGRWSAPESGTDRPSGGLLTAQDARRMTGAQITKWLSSAPADVAACLGDSPAEQIASQGAMLMGSPVHDALVPLQATQAL